MPLILDYNESSIDDLQARTIYESWLLKEVYNVAEQTILFRGDPDLLRYPVKQGRIPFQGSFFRGNVRLFDWRAKFLEVGAPLTFVTSFKLLDMLMEWLLEHNLAPNKVPHQFSEKLKQLKIIEHLPPFIETKSWLWSRLISLYEHLFSFRNTIVHRRDFKSTNDALCISDSKTNETITIAGQELRHFAILVITLLESINNGQKDNPENEKFLRFSLDELVNLHKQPPLGQKHPYFLTVRVCAKWSDPIAIDLEPIYKDINQYFPNLDTMFDLRIIVVEPTKNQAMAYLLPWHDINQGNGCSQFVRNLSEVAHLKCPLPQDFDMQFDFL